MKNLKFWIVCIAAFAFWKLAFSTDSAKDALKSVATQIPSLSPAQIKQIEEIAQGIAAQSNANRQAMLDEMTTSFNAVAIGRNVRFEHVIRTKKGLPPQKLKEWLTMTRDEILPKSCLLNAKNPAFDRGLSYTFAYSNAYGEKLGEVFVDKPTCQRLGF